MEPGVTVAQGRACRNGGVSQRSRGRWSRSKPIVRGPVHRWSGARRTLPVCAVAVLIVACRCALDLRARCRSWSRPGSALTSESSSRKARPAGSSCTAAACNRCGDDETTRWRSQQGGPHTGWCSAPTLARRCVVRRRSFAAAGVAWFLATSGCASDSPRRPAVLDPASPSNGDSAKAPEPQATPPAASADAPTAGMFSCPMHPEVRQSSPGRCPKCGMNLVPAPEASPPMSGHHHGDGGM